MDISAANEERRSDKKGRNWHERLHLRKAAVQPPTMQSQDKRGPKKIAEEWERGAAWPSSKRTSQQAQGPAAGDALRFTCSQCRDDNNAEYLPKDLARHYEDRHGGGPPVFSCRACAFHTHELSYLQVHLLSHADAFSSCAVCHDGVRRTWPELSAHLAASHCRPNGRYSCEACGKFSTGDVRAFLEHASAHGGAPEGGDPSQAPKLGPKAAAAATRTQKWSVDARRVKAVHVCQNGNRAAKRGVHPPAATKPNDPVPNAKPRLTRSAVRDVCWLTQDCLSLPGREFLDKYCHLSDPQTTLEETQQFLMKSVAGETGDQKWTKALKTVLSNVPQDLTLHPRSENGLASDASDLTVLTVKNKITVAPNGAAAAAYAKRLRRMTSPDKEPAFPEGAGEGALCAVGRNGRQPDPSDRPPCAQAEAKLHHDDPPPSSAPGGASQRENRENRVLKADEEAEEPAGEEAADVSGELKLTSEGAEQASAHGVPPRGGGRSRRPRRRRRRRRRRRGGVRGGPPGLPLKIVLKKNPVEGRQWAPQNGPAAEGLHRKWTKAEAPGEGPIPAGSENAGIDQPTTSPPPPGTEESCLAAEASRAEACPGNAQPRAPGGAAAAGEGAAPHSEPSPDPHPVITQDAANPGDPSPASPLEPSDQSVSEGGGGVPAPSAGGEAVQREPSPAPGLRWQPVPKTRERTLKLVAISPSQPVKRPWGDQPVVVLNHPDADIPEVARIMEVVNRYRGEVQKVTLSRRTLSALSAADGEAPDSPGRKPVQERFLLRLRLRRLSRRKYEVVGGAASPPPGGDGPARFRCWFCGRVFSSQEIWTLHRQRHLMEWKRPNCENS